ncbi:MAG: acetate--CoA ligase, partial [Cyanobacteriota bacterium]
MIESNIESILQEKRVFNPPPEFAAHAAVRNMTEYQKLYNLAAKDPAGFWAKLAE